jgi:hypothetical protein
MSSSKTYLNVPYAEKDAAKALGAKWDATNKKWYAPGTLNISDFAKWHDQSAAITTSARLTGKPESLDKPKTTLSGVFTQPTIKDFVAYAGDEPPWD